MSGVFAWQFWFERMTDFTDPDHQDDTQCEDEAPLQVKTRPDRRPGFRWLLPLLVFILAFAPRAISLNRFLTADEDDQLQFSVQFLEAVSQGKWVEAVVVGYPGVPTMSLGALGVWMQDQPLYQQLDSFLAASLSELKKPPLSTAAINDASGSAVPFETSHTVFLPLVSGVNIEPEPLPPVAAVTGSPLDYIQLARLPLVFMSALAITFVFLALRNLVDQRLALLATLMLAFDPFIMAHSRILHVDAPLAYFMFAAFIAFIVYLDRGKWTWLVFSAVLGALGVLSKTPGVLLGPILIAAGLFYTWLAGSKADRRQRFKRLALALLVWGAIAAIAFFLLWPSMWTRPGYALTHITDNLLSVMQFESHPTSGNFWGPTQSDRSPFYYLIAIPFHLTPLSTVGLLAGLGMIVAGFIHRRQQIQSFAAQCLPFLLSLLAYDVLFVGPVSLVARRGDRYILPVYFALDVMAAFGLWGLALAFRKGWQTLFKQQTPAFQPNVTFALLSIPLLAQIFFVGQHHPYYLTYFNPLLGGARTAPYLINVGWGEGLDQAAAYLNEKLNASDMTVAAWYSWQFGHFFEGTSVDLSTNNPSYSADYTVFYINQVQRGFPSEELLDYFSQRVPEKVVTLGGIDYAWIYPGPIVDDSVPDALTHLLNVPFRDSVMLAGIDLPATQAKDEIPVTLYWQVLNPLPGDFNVSLRLVDQDGLVWGRIDRFPIGGLIRTRSWLPGKVMRDEYMLKLEPGTPPGTYNFDVLMYDYDSGQIYGQAQKLGYVHILPSEKAVDVEALKSSLPDQTDAELSPNMRLLGHDLALTDWLPGEQQTLRLYWQASGWLKDDRSVTLLARHESGREITFLTDSIGPDDYGTGKWYKGQVLAEAYTFAFPLDAEAGQYSLIAQGSQEAILGQIRLKWQNRIFSLPVEEQAHIELVSAQLGQAIQLSGYRLDQDDETVELDLYWSALSTPQENYAVFVHLADANDKIVAQQDQKPVQDRRPTTTWFPAELVKDSYQISAPPGEYTIWVGMYNPDSGQRLTAHYPSGIVSEDRIKLTTIQVSGQ